LRKTIAAIMLSAAVTLLVPDSPSFFLHKTYAAARDQAAQLVINGEVVPLPEPLRLINDSLYAPARLFFEKLGYTVSWDASAGTVTAEKPGSTVQLTPGTDVLLVNRLVVRIAAPTSSIDGSVWIPARAAADGLGLEVKWNILTQTLFIKPGPTSKLTEMVYTDTSLLRYEGEMRGGIREGSGKLFLDGTLWYEGQFSSNQFEGAGRLYDKDMLVFEGNFTNNRPNGRGILTLPSGDQYKGEFRDGLQHGEGELYKNTKLVYSGQWVNGTMNGVGRFYNSQGNMIYSGGVVDNVRSGFGVAYDENGKKIYDGQWNQGVREGKGQAYGADEKLAYEGSWKNDKQDGNGLTVRFGKSDWVITENEKVIGTESRDSVFLTEATYRNGILIAQGKKLAYSGEQSKDGLPHGKGKLSYMQEQKATQAGVVNQYVPVYEGDFKFGKMTGYGKMYDDAGHLAYEGELVDGVREGKGQGFEQGVMTYEGLWHENREQGTGRKYTYESGQVTADFKSRSSAWIYEGIYNQGKLETPGKIYKFFGQLLNGRPNGQGYTVLMYDPDSDFKPSLPLPESYKGELIYEGEFKDGYRHGTGTLYDEDKNGNMRLFYEGDFKKGIRDGTGKEYVENSVYTGPFLNDERNGTGKIAEISNPDEIRFEGEFRNGLKHGHGKEYYIGGNVLYDGEYYNNQRHGYGQIYHDNGVVYYQGQFRFGEPVDSFYSGE
jgi:hypothetical protein